MRHMGDKYFLIRGLDILRKGPKRTLISVSEQAQRRGLKYIDLKGRGHPGTTREARKRGFRFVFS